MASKTYCLRVSDKVSRVPRPKCRASRREGLEVFYLHPLAPAGVAAPALSESDLTVYGSYLDM